MMNGGTNMILGYFLAQLSALFNAAESISTKSELKKFHPHEHTFYKQFVLLFFALLFGLLNWHMTLYGLGYVAFAIVIVFFNEVFRSRAMQSLELNAFTLLTTLGIFGVYGVELAIGREEFHIKEIIGITFFIGAFYVFLDIKIKTFIEANKTALLYVLGMIALASFSRPLLKTVLDNDLFTPEASILLRVGILVVVFYYFGIKRGLSVKESGKEGVRSHTKIGFFKYSREFASTYALVYGSAMLVTLVASTVLFLTFILSGFFFKESKWTWKKGIAVFVAFASLCLVLI